MVHGSAGWYYRGGCGSGPPLASACGERASLSIRASRAWRGFEIAFRYHSSEYEIEVSNPNGVTRLVGLTMDGTTLRPGSELNLSHDGSNHHVRVVLGLPQRPSQDRSEFGSRSASCGCRVDP